MMSPTDDDSIFGPPFQENRLVRPESFDPRSISSDRLLNKREQDEILKLKQESAINIVLRKDILQKVDFEVISRDMWDFLKTHNIAPNCQEIKRIYEKPIDRSFSSDIDLNYQDVSFLTSVERGLLDSRFSAGIDAHKAV